MDLRAKTAICTVFVILSNVAGNAVINWGVKSSQSLVLGAGIGLLILWVLARMTLLSWADLSWVLPVTAIGYVLSAAAGLVFFGEHVSGLRWMGAILVAGGAALAAPHEERT
jgi:uncharacterized membrane protein